MYRYTIKDPFNNCDYMHHVSKKVQLGNSSTISSKAMFTKTLFHFITTDDYEELK